MFSKINRAFKKSRSEDGFTLIELLIVIVIIGILAAIAIPVFLNQQNAAHDASVKSDARNTVIGVASALVTKPDTTGFSVLAAGDTVTATVKLVGVPSVAVVVPPGAVAVRAVVTQSNWVTVRGTGADYVVHAQSTIDGFWYEFSSKTGKYTSSTDVPAVTPAIPSSKDPVPNSVKNPNGIAVRVPGDPVASTGGTGGGSQPPANAFTALSWHQLTAAPAGLQLVGTSRNHETLAASPYVGDSVWISHDSGRTWESHVISASPSNWNSITVSPDGTVIILLSPNGYGDVQNKVSYDSGTTWTVLPFNTAPYWAQGFNGTTISDDNQQITVLQGSTLNRVWHSSDGGRTWVTSTVSTTSSYATDISASSDGKNIYVVSSSPQKEINVSHDYGVTWALLAGVSDISGVTVSADGNTIYVTSPGFYQKSTDGGLTWNTGTQSKRAILASADGSKLLILDNDTYPKTVMSSADGGNSWVRNDGPSGVLTGYYYGGVSSRSGATVFATATPGPDYSTANLQLWIGTYN